MAPRIVDLITFVVTTINAWNRLAIALRAVPGHYRPASSTAAAASEGTFSADSSSVQHFPNFFGQAQRREGFL